MIGRFILTLTHLILGFITLILAVRLLLKLFAASTAAPFVRWVYETSQPLLAPFEGMFPTTVANGFVIEISTLFALLVYAFAGYIIEEVISYLTYHRTRLRERHEVIEEEV